MQFLTGKNTDSALEALGRGARILAFNRETKLTKQCKNYPKIHGQIKGGGVAPSPPLNMQLGIDAVHLFMSVCLSVAKMRTQKRDFLKN